MEKFEKICRFCGFEKSIGKFLFSSETVKIGLLSKIKQLFPEEMELINTEAVLPKFICDTCEITVNYFFEFYNSVKTVQETLRKKIESEKSTSSRLNDHFCSVIQKHSMKTVSINSTGTIRCADCDKELDRNPAWLSIDRPIFSLCVCSDCGYKDEIALFVQKKTSNLHCPRCSFVEKNSNTNAQTERCGKEKSNFKCEVCAKVFLSKGHLNRHKLTHFGAKPYLCENCGAEFNQRSTLKTHTLIHKKSTPFPCKWCGQQFRHKQTMLNHVMNIHGYVSNGNTLYECDNCKKKFVNKSKLRRHYRTHSGEKPFECNICHKTFSQNVNLKTHYKKHENETSQYENLSLYSSQTVLNDAEEGKLIQELFTDCEQLNLSLSSISSSADDASTSGFSSKIQDQFNAQDSLPLKTSVDSSDMYYDISSSSYMMYPNDSDLYESDKTSQILPTFSSLNPVP